MLDTSPFAAGYGGTDSQSVVQKKPPIPVNNKIGQSTADMINALMGAKESVQPQTQVPITGGSIGAETMGPKVSGGVSDIISQTASQYGIDPNYFARVAHIESSGNPNAVTGSYKGLFQIGPDEWQKYGGGGNVFDPAANARAAAVKMAEERDAFTAKYGRQPTSTEAYMMHQQGFGGLGAHMANPSAPAWQNMASTAEGRAKGPQWARSAIWGNVPTQYRNQYGGVDNITSQQFLDLWRQKLGLE